MAYQPGVRSDPIIPESNGTMEHPLKTPLFNRVKRHQTIKLADGTVIEGGSIVLLSNVLWIRIPKDAGYNTGTAAALFCNPDKTSRMESKMFDDKDPNVYEGYSTLTRVDTELSGTISIRMTK